MLVSNYVVDHAAFVFQGTSEEYLKFYYQNVIGEMDGADYEDERVVIKGCSNKPVPPSAYAAITALIKPHARSIMYGEPCSTVPIYKRPRKL